MQQHKVPAADPLTGGSWSDVFSSDGYMQYRIATSLNTTGSVVLKEAYALSAIDTKLSELGKVAAGASSSGNADIFVLTGQSISGSSCTISDAIDWVEY